MRNYPATEYVNELDTGNKNIPQQSSRTIPVLSSVSTTAYPHPEPEMIKDEAYTYFPASVPGEDHLLRWETCEGAKRAKSISELDLDFNGELLPGKKLILNAVYLATSSMSLSPGELIAEIYVDNQKIGSVICNKALPDDDRETDMCIVVDLVQAGITEALRTMENKQFMVKFKTKTGANASVTAYLDKRYRPTLQLNGALIDEIDNSVKYYYHTDHNKNIIALSNERGELTASWDYDAFGNIISQTGITAALNPFRFSSEYHDENLGLIYYNYRHYNPKDGRWISRDPIGEKGGSNLYSYLGNKGNDFDIRGNISSRLIGEPYGGWDGGFTVHWAFQLDNPAKETAYIVQKIERKTLVTDINGNVLIDKEDRYWETWKVEKGNQTCNGRGAIFDQWNTEADDHWSHKTMNMGTCGTIIMKGTLNVYSEKRTGNLTEKWASNRHPLSLDLPSTKDEELWWGNPGSNGEKIAVNTLIATWSGIKDRTVRTDVFIKQTRKY